MKNIFTKYEKVNTLSIICSRFAVYCLLFIVLVVLSSACSPKVSTKLPEAKPQEQPQWDINQEPEEITELPEKPEETTTSEPERKGAFEVNTVPAAPIVVAALKREPCYGKCPAFDIELYDDGTVKYNGKAYVKKLGRYTAYLSKQAIVNIQMKAEEIGYFSMDKQYPPNHQAQIYDIPKTTTFIKIGDKEHRITNRHGSPSALFKFENYIEEQLQDLDWQPVR